MGKFGESKFELFGEVLNGGLSLMEFSHEKITFQLEILQLSLRVWEKERAVGVPIIVPILL